MVSRGFLGSSLVAFALLCGARGTQDAVANGDTRTINIYHEHTKESASITFKRNGYYDQAALKELNWLLRDWRLDEPIRMEPKLFDIVWEVYREVGSAEPIHVVSAYRSPQTNAMLRARSKAVAEHSQHMLGHAMDFYLPDVAMSRVREVGMRLQEGGVGFYPNAYNPFVHLDAGSVRSWPRMSGGELARLFPDGRTVHMPRDGKPMPGYEEAKATILARGGSVAGYSTVAEGGEETGRKSLWAMLFGGGDDEDSDFYRSSASRTRQAGPTRVASAAPSGGSANSDDGGARGFFSGPVSAPVEEPRAFGRSRRGGRNAVAAAERPVAPSAAPPVQVASAAPGFEASSSSSLTPSSSLSAAEPRTAAASPARVEILDTVPVPPRRPGELEAILVAMPLPPTRPIEMAAFGGAAPVVAASLNGQMRAPPARRPASAPIAAGDERAALRALFEAAATPTSPAPQADIATSRTRPEPLAAAVALADPGSRVRMVFSSASLDALGADAFSGPAVAPLPILQ